MHLFAPERPEVTPGRKALLLDGSAIPHFVVEVIASDKVRISALLAVYNHGGGYSYHHREVYLDQLESYFESFHNDPEGCLEELFGWVPQSRAVPATASPRFNKSAHASAYADQFL